VQKRSQQRKELGQRNRSFTTPPALLSHRAARAQQMRGTQVRPAAERRASTDGRREQSAGEELANVGTARERAQAGQEALLRRLVAVHVDRRLHRGREGGGGGGSVERAGRGGRLDRGR
jgi:hypothetical protein